MTGRNLEAWNVDAAAYPASGTTAAKSHFAVRYAVLAPSSHNTQPWQFIVDDGGLLVCADRTRSLPNIDPFDRELIISCGAALFNLRVVFAHFGIPVEITTFPYQAEPDTLARIEFPDAGPIPSEIGEFLEDIAARATNRHPFAEEGVPDDLVERIAAAAQAEAVDVRFARSLDERERIAGLIADADRRQFDDPRFRRELASWIHPSRSSDGMPAFSQGIEALSDAATPIVTMAIRTFDLGNGVAAAHERLARGSPLLLALSTPMDGNEAWLATGQALERVLLVVAHAGYAASYLNQPIEVPELRQRLADDLGAAGCPQLLLRVGRGAAAPHSPRRPLAEVVTVTTSFEPAR